MAQRVVQCIVGMDVSKKTLDVFEWESNQSYSIATESKAIERWLAQWEVPMRLAIEPTNRYHQLIAEAAHTRGHEVWLINPYRLPHY